MSNSDNCVGHLLYNNMNKYFFDICGCNIDKKNMFIYIDSDNLKEQIVNILNEISVNYNNSKYDILNIKEDMIFKVFVLQYCVVRICETKTFIDKYKNIIDKIISINNINIEYIYKYYTTNKYVLLISKRIEPLIIHNEVNKNINIDFDEIYNQITKTIGILLKHNLSHNDVRLDNIGYDKQLNTYVLFDFDKTCFTNINNDINNLIMSIYHYMK